MIHQPGFQFAPDAVAAKGTVAGEGGGCLRGKLLIVQVSDLAQAGDCVGDALRFAELLFKGTAKLGH